MEQHSQGRWAAGKETSARQLSDVQHAKIPVRQTTYNNLVTRGEKAEQSSTPFHAENITREAENLYTHLDDNEGAAYWLKNLPSLQDLVASGGHWNDHHHGDQEMTQHFDSLKEWNNSSNTDFCGVMVNSSHYNMESSVYSSEF